MSLMCVCVCVLLQECNGISSKVELRSKRASPVMRKSLQLTDLDTAVENHRQSPLLVSGI